MNTVRGLRISNKDVIGIRKILFGRGAFICFTIVMILLIALGIKGTVLSMEKKHSDKAMEKYYAYLEKEYEKSVREVLRDSGYANAGVMLTEVTKKDGSLEYTLTINHRRFENNPESRQKLTDRIKEIDLGIENASVTIVTTYQ